MPALALLFNALVWGVSWWPFRLLQSHGLHPLWTTALVYAVATLCLLLSRPAGLRELARTPGLWVLALSAGATTAAFNWGVTIGDVVRVVLLFYLMPLWAALLARVMLGEPLTRLAAMRIALALAGAVIVLWPPGHGLATLPVPRSLADWLGVIGGVGFALNNVMLRREARRSELTRGLAMFLGGTLVAGGLALVLAASSAASAVPLPPAPALVWVLPFCALALLFVASNLALQYGASRMSVNAGSVVMLSEVLFAAGSAVLWGDGRLSAPLLAGGSLIVAAALLAALEHAGAPAPVPAD